MSRATAVSGLASSQIDCYIVGIVNGAHVQCNLNKLRKVEVALDDGVSRFLTPPDGFDVPEHFNDRQWLHPCARDHAAPLKNTRLSYWVLRDLPTEDKAKLLGYLASHVTLSIDADSDAGRLIVTYRNGRQMQITGGNTPGHQLISLLVNEDDKHIWDTGNTTEHLSAIEQDDPEFRKASDFAHESFRRLFELDTVDDAKLAAYLSQNKDLIDGASVHRLSQMDKVMPHLLRNVKALVAKQPEEFTEPALAFFRKLRPDLAQQEPAEGGSVEWWLSKLNVK